jgi:hypothetical protein
MIVTKKLETVARGLKKRTIKFTIVTEEQLAQKVAALVDNEVLSYFKQTQELLEADVIQSSVIISSVLSLMAMMGIERSRVERDLMYRSNLLGSLYTYLESRYSVVLAMASGIPPSNILDMIREDRAIFDIFLLVLNRRLTIIDDLEF